MVRNPSDQRPASDQKAPADGAIRKVRALVPAGLPAVAGIAGRAAPGLGRKMRHQTDLSRKSEASNGATPREHATDQRTEGDS